MSRKLLNAVVVAGILLMSGFATVFIVGMLSKLISNIFMFGYNLL